jgi:hypothetical protein
VSTDREGVPVSVAWILLAALGSAILLTNLMRTPDVLETETFPVLANPFPGSAAGSGD